MSLTWTKLKQILDEAKKPNSATVALNKIGDKITAAFTPEKMKEMDAKRKAAQEADPKFQEWKQKRDADMPRRQKLDAEHLENQKTTAAERDKQWGRKPGSPLSFTRPENQVDIGRMMGRKK